MVNSVCWSGHAPVSLRLNPLSLLLDDLGVAFWGNHYLIEQLSAI